jgi:hypothetical protein
MLFTYLRGLPTSDVTVVISPRAWFVCLFRYFTILYQLLGGLCSVKWVTLNYYNDKSVQAWEEVILVYFKEVSQY